MSDDNKNIDKFFKDIEDNFNNLLGDNYLDNNKLYPDLRQSVIKIYKNLKSLANAFDIDYKVPKNVKRVSKIKNYNVQIIGKNDWIVNTDEGDFVYIYNKNKWYFYIEDAYNDNKLGKSIKQEELIRILSRKI